MPEYKLVIDLSAADQNSLRQLIGQGNPPTRKAVRAWILLQAHAGWTDEQTAQSLQVCLSTVKRVRNRFVEEGLESALVDRPRTGRRRKLSGNQEARIIAEVCAPAPKGHARWTLRLLADRVVALGLAESISHETVRQVLKKTTSSQGRGTSEVGPE